MSDSVRSHRWQPTRLLCPWDFPGKSTGVEVILHVQFSSVQSLSRVWLFATPWIAARQASLSITNSWSSLRLMSIESVMPSSHLILCCPLLLLPRIPPSIRVFLKESVLPMRWPRYWSFSFSIIPSKEIPGLISFRMDWLYLNEHLKSLSDFLLKLEDFTRYFLLKWTFSLYLIWCVR